MKIKIQTTPPRKWNIPFSSNENAMYESFMSTATFTDRLIKLLPHTHIQRNIQNSDRQRVTNRFLEEESRNRRLQRHDGGDVFSPRRCLSNTNTSRLSILISRDKTPLIRPHGIRPAATGFTLAGRIARLLYRIPGLHRGPRGGAAPKFKHHLSEQRFARVTAPVRERKPPVTQVSRMAGRPEVRNFPSEKAVTKALGPSFSFHERINFA